MLFDDLFIQGLIRPADLSERRQVYLNNRPNAGTRRRPAKRGVNCEKKQDFWADANTPDKPTRDARAREVRAENAKRVEAALRRCPRASRVS